MSEEESSGQKSWLERISGAFSNEPRDREQLKEILNEAVQSGVLDADVLAMMEGALEVSEMQVRDAMVPRSQMVVIPRDGALEDFLPQILESGHSRFPVIGGDRDQIEGILLAKDLLRHFANGDEAFDLADVLRPAVVIPESKRLNMLLRDFRSSRNHMAIVVDEYGGVSGLITIEDVLEEIVGEIDDEHDEEDTEALTWVEDNRYLVQALMPIEDFNEAFSCHLSDDVYDTIGGLVLAEFGRVPERGEVVQLAERFEFRVAGSDSRRIITLELTVLAPA
ncbi:MAG: CBS domain-containing protein [Xanthomonadales bacterium]|nr:CBS domain-containing protein [Xanthomonadales bacterium]